MTPDTINGLFELGGACLVGLNVWKLQRDKMVRGVHWGPVMFFTGWGLWNLYYYPHLEQWYSWVGGAVLVGVNSIWLAQMIYYRRS